MTPSRETCVIGMNFRIAPVRFSGHGMGNDTTQAWVPAGAGMEGARLCRVEALRLEHRLGLRRGEELHQPLARLVVRRSRALGDRKGNGVVQIAGWRTDDIDA